MNKILAASVLILECASAPAPWAQAAAPATANPRVPLTTATAIKQVVPYQTVCSSFTIGTSTVEVTGNTNISSTTAAVSWVRVRDLSATATVYCSNSAAVRASGASTGEPVMPYSAGEPNAVEWLISTMQPWYCIASGAATPVILCTRQ